MKTLDQITKRITALSELAATEPEEYADVGQKEYWENLHTELETLCWVVIDKAEKGE